MTGLRFKLAAIAFGALVLARPGLAVENWPDSLHHYVAIVRNEFPLPMGLVCLPYVFAKLKNIEDEIETFRVVRRT